MEKGAVLRSVVVLLMICLTILLSSCRTETELFNVTDVCSEFKHLDNSSDLRDPYDECVLEKNEQIQKPEFCDELCHDHCEDIDMNFLEIVVDFSGCWCTCQVR